MIRSTRISAPNEATLWDISKRYIFTWYVGGNDQWVWIRSDTYCCPCCHWKTVSCKRYQIVDNYFCWWCCTSLNYFFVFVHQYVGVECNVSTPFATWYFWPFKCCRVGCQFGYSDVYWLSTGYWKVGIALKDIMITFCLFHFMQHTMIMTYYSCCIFISKKKKKKKEKKKKRKEKEKFSFCIFNVSNIFVYHWYNYVNL